MKNIRINSRIVSFFAILIAVMFLPWRTQATPYASEVTNNAGTIQFYLNESNATVVVTYEDGSTNVNFDGIATGTNLLKGAKSFSLAGHSSYKITVTKIGNGLASVLATYPIAAAGGVDVNKRPQSPNFGQVYAVARGLQSQGLRRLHSNMIPVTGGTNGGGVAWTTSTSEPWRLAVNEDDYLTVGSYSSAGLSGVWRIDPTLSTNQLMLGPPGDAAGLAANSHGSEFSRPLLIGNLQSGGSAVLYTVDAGNFPFNSSALNSILVYSNLTLANLPRTNAPDLLGPETTFNLVLNNNYPGITTGGTNGYIYISNRRDNADKGNVQVYDANLNLLWISLYNGGLSDYFIPLATSPGINLVGLGDGAVSADGQFFAGVGLTDNRLMICALTNGIPDISTLYTVVNVNSTSQARGLCWDAADNVYVSSSGVGAVQQWSLGLTAKAITMGNATGATNFALIQPATKVSVSATTPNASQSGPTPGVFTVTRSSTISDDTNTALNVLFTLTGTAVPGTYTVSGATLTTTVTNFVTNNIVVYTTYPSIATNRVITTNYVVNGYASFAAGLNLTNVTITPDTASVSRPTTTVILTLAGAGNYASKAPVTDTVLIQNTGSQYLFISGVDALTMYRGYSNDYASFIITRWGDTNAASYNVASYTYTGSTAALGSDFYGAGTISMDPGVLTITNYVTRTAVAPSGVYVGNKSIIVGLGSGGGSYTAGPNTAALTLIDNASPLTNVLFSDALTNPADSSNWVITYGTGDPTNNASNYNVDFGYDMTTDPGANGIVGLPPNGATTALRLTCNKLNYPGAAGGVNVYFTNQLFSGNYAVHFDMNLIEGANLTYATEGVLFGVNHTGSQSNWWYGSGPIPTDGTWGSDGVWYWVSADPGGASATTAGDFLEFTGAGGTNNNSGWQKPEAKIYTAFGNVYKDPTIFTTQEGTPPRSGVPANGSPFAYATTNWSNVEIKQFKNGATSYLTTLSINNYTIFTYTNTTVWTNGYLMLGYADPYGGTGGISVGAPDAAAYFSNLKVVSVPAPVITLQPTNLVLAAGSAATYAVAATFDASAANTNGQWFFNGTNAIAGATNQTYSFTVASANYGTYSWTVIDRNYTVSSANVTLRPPAFTITTNPVAGYVVAAGLATNLVSAANSFSGVTNYQWQINSVNIPGATSRIYSFTSGPTNYGTFRVIINDNWNYATSSVAVVTPPLPNIVSVLPTTGAAVLGGSATLFTVTAQTFSGLTNYQWLSNSVPISGATSRTLSLANVQAGNFGSIYTVRVNDGTTSITNSSPATLTLAVSQLITSPALNGTQFKFSFNTESGPSYVVDSKTNLLQASWVPLSTNAGTGGTVNVTNTTSGNQGYYRLRLQ